MECYSVKMTTRTRPDRRQAMADQTRRDILHTARELFARQGYAATSVTDIAREAGVAVQTIYARLGSKRGMLMALIDLIDQEAGAGDLAAAVAEGQRRHRDGARLAVARIAELGGLRENLAPERAAALIAIATTHEAWRELRDAYRLSWDDAEALLCDMLGRAVLPTSPAPARRQSQRKTAAPASRPAPARLPARQPGAAIVTITIFGRPSRNRSFTGPLPAADVARVSPSRRLVPDPRVAPPLADGIRACLACYKSIDFSGSHSA